MGLRHEGINEATTKENTYTNILYTYLNDVNSPISRLYRIGLSAHW